MVTRRRLTKSYKAMVGALKAIDVPVFEGQGTLMLWADFRKFLPENSFRGEDILWEEIFSECKWLITRGQQYLCTEPGWFRVMFTSQEWVSEELISAPFDALKERLIQWKEKREGKMIAAAPSMSQNSPKLQTGNQSHFYMDDDDDLEEYEQCPDLKKAYSMIEA